MSDPFSSFDFKVENYLNWVNTVGRHQKKRQRPRPRKQPYKPWGCALPSSMISALLLAALALIVQ